MESFCIMWSLWQASNTEHVCEGHPHASKYWLWPDHSPSYVSICHAVFIHQPVDGHLGFQLRAITVNAAVNVCTQVLVWTDVFILPVWKPGVELLCRAAKFSSARNCPSFPEWLLYFISPEAVSEGSLFSTASPALTILDVLCSVPLSI